MNLFVRNDKPYALKPGEKAHFAKIMVIRWVMVESISRDMMASADFTTVDCKRKASKCFLPPSLLDEHEKFVLKSRKLHSFPILGHFGIQNSEKMHIFLVNLGVYFQE